MLLETNICYAILAQGEQSGYKSTQGCCQSANCYTHNLKWPQERWDEGCGEEAKANTCPMSLEGELILSFTQLTPVRDGDRSPCLVTSYADEHKRPVYIHMHTPHVALNIYKNIKYFRIK